jgi:tRNA (uracil-5-)-methyltransferase TRM9
MYSSRSLFRINTKSRSSFEPILRGSSSSNLISIAKTHHPHAAIVADNLSLPHPLHIFDFAISIAVIHHLSTPIRRIEAVKAVLDLLLPPKSDECGPSGSSVGGRALIYVWALEQKDSRRGWDEGGEQDVMVPWVRKGEKVKQDKGKGKGKGRRKDDGAKAEEEGAKVEEKEVVPVQEDKTFLRYYHLYKKGELEHDIEKAGGQVVESGYEKDNWWAIAVLKRKDS